MSCVGLSVGWTTAQHIHRHTHTPVSNRRHSLSICVCWWRHVFDSSTYSLGTVVFSSLLEFVVFILSATVYLLFHGCQTDLAICYLESCTLALLSEESSQTLDLHRVAGTGFASWQSNILKLVLKGFENVFCHYLPVCIVTTWLWTNKGRTCNNFN